MHYCGNPFHDILVNAAFGAPFIGYALFWAKHKLLSAKKKS